MSDGKGDLPSGWETASIGEVTLAKVEQVDRQGPLTYIDIGSVDNQSKRITEPKSLTTGEKIPSRARQRLATNDVLVSMTRPNLNAVALVPPDLDEAIGSTGFDVLRAIEIEPKWLFNIVKSRQFVESMSDIVQGALYPAVRPSDIRKYEIPVPPVTEQRRILTKIDALQERSRRARAALADVGLLLEQFRQSLLVAAFRGDLTADWRAAHPNIEPATELLTRIRQERRRYWEESELAKYEVKGKQPPKNWQDRYESSSELDLTTLPPLPEKWCYARADELVEPGTVITYGIVLPGPTLQDGVPYIRGQDIENGQILFEQLLRTSAEIHGKHHRSEVQSGDVLLCVIRHLKVALVPQGVAGVNLTQGTVRLRPSNVVRGSYLSSYLSGPTAQHWMKLHHFGLAMPRINVEDARAVPIPLPPLEEQQQIVDLVSDVLTRWSSIHESTDEVSEYLATLDQSILTKAFRGELVPQDPNDEPASLLLERIRQQRNAQSAKSIGKANNRRAKRQEA